MRQLLAIFLFTAACPVQAQEFSVGARTGIGKNFYLRDDNRDQNLSHTTWDKQVFARYQSRKRIALEVGAEHYNYKSNYHSSDLVGDQYMGHYDPKEINSAVTTGNMVLYASVQFDIMCRKVQKSCPLLKNMRSYMGIVLAPVAVTDRTQGQIRNLVTGETKSYTRQHRSVMYTGGLNHTLSYQLSKHLSFSSVLSYRMDLSDALAGDFPAFENHIGYQIGAGYTF